MRGKRYRLMVQLLIYTYMERKDLCKSSILFRFERVTLKKFSIALHIHTTALVAQTDLWLTKITILCLSSSRRAKSSRNDLYLPYILIIRTAEPKESKIKGKNDALKDTQLCLPQFLI